MTCTIGRLAWQSAGHNCGGNLCKIKDLTENMDVFLKNKKSNSPNDPPVTQADMVLNYITPFYISPGADPLGNLDICSTHVEKLTKGSKLFKREKCAVANCNRTGTRRVSLTSSVQIFSVLGQHCPIGSGVCAQDRHKVEEGLKEKEYTLPWMDLESVIKVEHNEQATPEASSLGDAVSCGKPPRPKRKVNMEGSSCKMVKSESLASASEPDSQGSVLSRTPSTFSDTSDPDDRRELTKLELEQKMTKLNFLSKSLESIGISFEVNFTSLLDENASQAQFREKATHLSNLVESLSNLLIYQKDPTASSSLLEAVANQILQSVGVDSDTLANAVLHDMKSYFSVLRQSSTRESAVARGLVLESAAGEEVIQKNLVTGLAKFLGARINTVFKCSKDRKLIVETNLLIPFASRLARNSPNGHEIPLEWKLKLIVFMESDHVSEVQKGYHNVYKEKTKSVDGSEVGEILRAKRVLKMPALRLLNQARLDIGWPFGISSILRLRPPWINLASARYNIGCLCELCHNLSLLVRALNSFITKASRGTAYEKDSVKSFSTISSVSTLVDMILHPKEEGKDLHNSDCFNQCCDQTLESCGKKRFEELFEPLGDKLGYAEIEIFQHLKLSYDKPDKTKGTKYELTKLNVNLLSLLQRISERLFTNKQNFLIHTLRKKLGTMARKSMRQHLGVRDVIIYTDFSKALKITHPMTLKSESYGASNKDYELNPEVWEMVVLPPSAPQNLLYDSSLSFSPPKYPGGSRIQRYEIDVQDPVTGIWYLIAVVDVKPLSPEPRLDSEPFKGLSGEQNFRIYAVNLAGRGAGAFGKVLLPGSSPFNPDRYKEVEESQFSIKYCTFWEEHHHFSDKHDAPKDWKTILLNKKVTLADITQHHNRTFDRTFIITDTGGENWGVEPLAVYSWSEQDLNMETVWCPTAANHSGQPSDSAGGTLKSGLNRDAKAGNLMGINCAEDLVEHCNANSSFGQTHHKKYLNAITTRRRFYHVTKDKVDELMTEDILRERKVKKYPGVTSFKQAFSVGEPNKLLVREYICCCSYCMDRDFDQCINKDEVEADMSDDLETIKKGNIYACISHSEDDEDGGYILAQCLDVSSDSLNVSFLQKCGGSEREYEQYFKDLGNSVNIDIRSVHTPLITVYKVSDKLYSVNQVELDEIVLSINC